METILILIQWIKENPAIVIAAVAFIWEVVFRRIPTAKDWSIINLIAKLIDSLIRNRKKTGGAHRV
jgi:hypothetical protein